MIHRRLDACDGQGEDENKWGDGVARQAACPRIVTVVHSKGRGMKGGRQERGKDGGGDMSWGSDTGG